jgi:4-oxalocrotonate tautomerase
MPYVTISTVRGMLDSTQKQALLERVTDLLVEVEGRGNPDFRRTVWVKIEEQEPANWSLGGVILTPEIIAATFAPVGEEGRRAANAKRS